MHAFTGSDYVNPFTEETPMRSLKIVKASTEFKEPFALLGVRWSPPSNLHDKFE